MHTHTVPETSALSLIGSFLCEKAKECSSTHVLLKQPGLAQFMAVTSKWEQQGAEGEPVNTHAHIITWPITMRGVGRVLPWVTCG